MVGYHGLKLSFVGCLPPQARLKQWLAKVIVPGNKKLCHPADSLRYASFTSPEVTAYDCQYLEIIALVVPLIILLPPSLFI